MILGIGVDITEINRVKSALERSPKFLNRILTPTEIKAMASLSDKRKLEFVTGRFSAKESYSKAIGSGLGSKVHFQDITIVNDDHGKPIIKEQPYDLVAHLSISHTNSMVMTEVLLEKRN
ncbi:holo-ACP synthase [Lentilactobacillus sp. Marseille-Q4993]|uniref:holo-ACP synthase n=1 Tax=Lentilactobacillus sp. Marseille-Q4993 TaxID=3039492 RepID=UPI0024BCD64D|nr:holo-ACP synthase [Lentilactobacillus sp. Marseille-Q4993]